MRWGVWALVWLLCLVEFSAAGCFQRRLCCRGRNNTCKDIDDGIEHVPTVATFHNEQKQTSHRTGEREYHTPYYESSGDGFQMIYPDVFDDEHNQKIGKLVLPDIVEMEGSGGEDLYNRYGHEVVTLSTQLPPTTPARLLKTLIFGEKTNPDEEPEEISRYLSYHPRPKHLLIRYSILSQHLPLRISTTPDTSMMSEEDESERPTLYYLEAAKAECYCDEACIALGDCCSDYTYVCPPRDCVVGDWGSWSGCSADQGSCGIGTQKRTQMRTCFVECRKPKSALDDVTTVALLLDYKYNTTRSNRGRNNIYWDLPEVAAKYRRASYYCVHYKISWVNRNCVSRLIAKGLLTGSTICAECQPEAQLHRNNARCASDLDDGDEGFWKLIGPQSCNGIWTRINRTDDCHCAANYPETHPFLLV
ncbi:unnamed protein product [Caenorhabditis auriculariae]|uniref:SMB domain-containing protein n=1 Tax=Caenorhabditis auriculariae TaxID=2777116 RepID=A0A8S1H534_9PELO|nr:unnamed protein product [Caenorhabditis auriculariae]